MTADGPADGVTRPRIVQNVYAFGGFAYGAVNADVHIHGDGRPVYTLEEHRRPAGEPDPRWVEQPSRLLDARHAVVPFTGREAELRDLADWRDRVGDPTLAVRWLHGPGGRGKTRLAGHLAAVSAAAGWKTIVVRHGGQASPESQGSHDGRAGDRVGLLVLVDYADRWPLQHLGWLFANQLFAQRISVRVLLLARTANVWPAVRSMLDDRAATSEQLLGAVPDGPGHRERVFTAARSRFAQLYGLASDSSLAPPESLHHPDLGLTLTLHMAALVAVDAHVTNRRTPEDVASLSAYLLDREREHWTRLHENRQAGLDFHTGTTTMAKVVFTAALTGATGHAAGAKALDAVGIPGHPQTILDDHRICYPPTDPELVLEPLYPDRLAEDFLALLTPGHNLAGYPTDPWTVVTPAVLLAGAGRPTTYTPRAITFLASAADRWPHLGQKILYPLLKAHPHLAMAAGSAALTAIAAIGGHGDKIDPELLDVLQTVQARFPDHRHVDLDAGIAAVVQRLAAHHLAEVSDPAMRGGIYTNLAVCLNNAGLHQQALVSSEEAVAIYRLLAARDPQFTPVLAICLSNSSFALEALGYRDRALAATLEAITLFKESPTSSPCESGFDAPYALALNNLSIDLSKQGRRKDAAATSEESVRIYRRLVAANPGEFERDLARALDTLGIHLSDVGSRKEALGAASESVDLFRSLATNNPQAFEPDWALALQNLGNLLSDAGRHSDAVSAHFRAVEVFGRLVETNPVVFEPQLGIALNNLSIELSTFGRKTQAVEAGAEAVAIYRRLVEASPMAFEHDLARLLSNLGSRLAETGQGTPAVSAIREAVGILRRLTIGTPDAFEPHLAGLLNDLSYIHAILQQPEEALAASSESVHLYRQLARAAPEAFERPFATALLNMSVALTKLRRWHDALETMRQVVDIRRRLATADPTGFLPELARSLSNLGATQSMLRQWDDALESTKQSVEIWRTLAATESGAFESSLAQSLIAFTWVRIRNQAHLAEAREAALDSIAIYRRLADREPQAFRNHLREAIKMLASIDGTHPA